MKKFDTLCEGIITSLKHPKMVMAAKQIANEVKKKVGGKIKNISAYDDWAGGDIIEVELRDPNNLYGDYGLPNKEDMKVVKIRFETSDAYYPTFDMVFHYKDGLAVDYPIKTAKDALEQLKDLS